MAITKNKSTTRQEKAKATRKKIFETAVKLFSEHGYDSVTVEDITTIAGVSKGTFYTYFKTKDSVLIEIFNSIDEQYAIAMDNADPSMSAKQKMLMLMDVMSAYCNDVIGIAFMKIVYANQICCQDEEQLILNYDQRPFYMYVDKIVQEGIETGLFPDRREELRDNFTMMARGLVYDWCLNSGKLNLKDTTHAFMEMFIDAISIK